MPVVGVFGYIVDVIFRVGCDNENWPCLLAKYGRPIARLKQNANIHQLAGLNVPEETSKMGIRRMLRNSSWQSCSRGSSARRRSTSNGLWRSQKVSSVDSKNCGTRMQSLKRGAESLTAATLDKHDAIIRRNLGTNETATDSSSLNLHVLTGGRAVAQVNQKNE